MAGLDPAIARRPATRLRAELGNGQSAETYNDTRRDI